MLSVVSRSLRAVTSRTLSRCKTHSASAAAEGKNAEQTLFEINLTDDEATAIIGSLDEHDRKQLSLIKVEFEKTKSEGRMVPANVSPKEWLVLLKEFPNAKDRFMLYRDKYIFEQETPPETPPMHEMWAQHGGRQNCKLCIDMSFQREMNEADIRNLAKEIAGVHRHNMTLKLPYRLHFTGLTPGGVMHKYIQRYLPGFDAMHYKATESCYTEHYSTEDLIYLTPYADVTIEKVDPDRVYILGGLLDPWQNFNRRGPRGKFTSSKAKRQGLKMASFPLQKYMMWRTGPRKKKILTLEQSFGVLSARAGGKAWEKAFSFIPGWEKRKDESERRRKDSHVQPQGLMVNPQNRLGKTKYSQIYLGERKNSQYHLGEKNSQNCLGENKNSQNHLGERKNSQNHLGENKNSQNHLGERKNSQNHLGERKNSQNHLGENKNSQNHLGENKNSQNHLGERKNFQNYLGERKNSQNYQGQKSPIHQSERPVLSNNQRHTFPDQQKRKTQTADPDKPEQHTIK